MSKKPVVAAAIFDFSADEPRILAASRAYPEDLRGRFELPGGKIEPDEQPYEALLREIREELGCTIQPDRPVLSDSEDGAWPILDDRKMYVWLAEAIETPEPSKDHLELRWVTRREARNLDWLKPDIPIVKAAFDLLYQN
ncbi:MAG: NUDIX domain-containing protein [Actinomycetaceae bacterium]|nr:NUDIX domain-containing protein [Actinomycetaceae bacterium]